MAKRKKNDLSDGKKQIIAGWLNEYDIRTAEDIQDALKDLLGGTIKNIMEAEINEHLGYERGQRSDSLNSWSGHKSKKVRSHYGEFDLSVSQDRESSFEPKIVSKKQKEISQIDEKIVAIYARGLTTNQISEQIEDIYGFEISQDFVSNVKNKILTDIMEWQNRPLSALYPIVFIDVVHFSVRDKKIIRKLAAYVVLGVNQDGYKEVLGLYIGRMKVVNTG